MLQLLTSVPLPAALEFIMSWRVAMACVNYGKLRSQFELDTFFILNVERKQLTWCSTSSVVTLGDTNSGPGLETSATVRRTFAPLSVV